MTSLGFPKPFDKNVSFVIATFLAPKQYKFLDWFALSSWVDESILKKNPEKIDWIHITTNKNAVSLISILLNNIKKIYSAKTYFFTFDSFQEFIWKCLNQNSSNFAVNLLLQNPTKIDWELFSSNSNQNAINALSQNQDKIDWFQLSRNPNGIHLLKEKTKDFTQNERLISWGDLCYNPNAIDIINKNPSKIAWFCLIKNPAAMEFITHWKKLPQYFYLLCENSGAIDVLKKNQDKINFHNLSWNEGIIELDLKGSNLLMNAYTKLVYNL